MRRELLHAIFLPAFVLACGSSATGSDSTAIAGASGSAEVGGNGSGQGGAGSPNGGTPAAGSPNGSAGMAGAGNAGAPMQTAGTGGGGAGGGGAGQGNAGSGGAANSQTPPEGVPPTYKLVYSQTFADPSSMSDLVFANPTQWRHNAGGFIESTGASYAPPYRSPFSLAIVKSIQVQSFVMDVEMLQTSPDGDAHRDMALIWSFVSPSEFYYAHVSTAHDGVAHNILIVNKADRKAISVTFTPGYDWGRNVWKRLRVVHDVESGSMAVYDLDAPSPALLTAKDTTFKGGYVGFGSFDNTGQVRNVKVWAATSTPANAPFFSPAP